MRQPKLLAWDLETTHLRGNMGHILCAAAKWVGRSKVYSWRIDKLPGYGSDPYSYINDKPIVEALIELTEEADATVAHYGERFDKRFLYTRAMMHGLAPPPPVKLIDTWKYARNNLALTSNRLETLASMLGTGNQKYKLPLEVWQIASHGHTPTLDKMVKYCKNDVLTLEDVYLRMRPLINDHPYAVELIGTCPACGSVDIQSRGFRRTRCFKIQRQHCTNCGSWFDGNRERVA